MKTLKFVHKPCSVVCLCAVFLVPATLSEASFVPNIRDHGGAAMSSFPLRPLRIVDCVLKRCMMLSSSRSKALCTYLLCIGGERMVGTPIGGVVAGSSASDVELTRKKFDAGRSLGHQRSIFASGQEKRKRGSDVTKRWQYPDPLQHCMQTNCQKARGVAFYTCVYKNCISALLSSGITPV